MCQETLQEASGMPSLQAKNWKNHQKYRRLKNYQKISCDNPIIFSFLTLRYTHCGKSRTLSKLLLWMTEIVQWLFGYDWHKFSREKNESKKKNGIKYSSFAAVCVPLNTNFSLFCTLKESKKIPYSLIIKKLLNCLKESNSAIK